MHTVLSQLGGGNIIRKYSSNAPNSCATHHHQFLSAGIISVEVNEEVTFLKEETRCMKSPVHFNEHICIHTITLWLVYQRQNTVHAQFA